MLVFDRTRLEDDRHAVFIQRIGNQVYDDHTAVERGDEERWPRPTLHQQRVPDPHTTNDAAQAIAGMV